MYYSPSTNGFYLPAIHGDGIPGDAKEITDDLYRSLIKGQEQGQQIEAGTDGTPKLVVVVASPEQVKAAKVAVVQAFMDQKAQELGYDSIASAVSYADEPAVQKFQDEGIAFRAWRSLGWETCNEILNAVNAGTRPVPTDADLLASLPALTLPAA